MSIKADWQDDSVGQCLLSPPLSVTPSLCLYLPWTFHAITKTISKLVILSFTLFLSPPSLTASNSLFLSLRHSLPLYLYLYLYLPLSLSLSLSLCLSVCLSRLLYVSVSLSFSLSLSLNFSLNLYLSLSLCVRQFICYCVYLSIS